MKIMLLTNRQCHCVDVEQGLEALGLRYTRRDLEDHPDIAQRFGIRHCPTLIVDERRVIPIDENNVGHLRQILQAD